MLKPLPKKPWPTAEDAITLAALRLPVAVRVATLNAEAETLPLAAKSPWT